jgi:hypothetical protein
MPQKQTPEQFFYEHAGYSYDPKKETPKQGRQRGAKALARAEAKASRLGYSFEWEIDQISDSSDFSNERPAYELYFCRMRDQKGQTLDTLGGIDFGRDGSPWGDPYRRVVEAELALEAA